MGNSNSSTTLTSSSNRKNSGVSNREILHLQELAEKAQESTDFVLPDIDCKKLLHALESNKLLKQQWAANVICFLCRDNVRNREKLGERGIKSLVVLLKSNNDSIVSWAVGAIANLCIDNPNNQARVIEFKGIDRILPLLNSPSVDIQRWAANAIGIICMDNAFNQEIVAKKGGIKDLIKCLRSESENVQKWAVFALGNLSYSKKNRALIVDEDVFLHLMKQLQKENNDTQRWTTNLICILCADNATHRSKLSQVQGIKFLIPLLSSQDRIIVRNTSLAIVNACKDCEINQKQALDAGVVPILFDILRKETQNTNLPNSQAIIQYCSNIIEMLIKNMDDIPKELQTLIKVHSANKTVLIKQMTDLVDKSGSVSLKLSYKFPGIGHIYEFDSSESNSNGDLEAEFGEDTIKQAETKLKELAISELTEENFAIQQPLSSKNSQPTFNIKYSDITIDFEDVIGLGAFGNVYKGTYQGNEVAVKELLNVENSHIRKLILREVQMLKNVPHPNIVQWLGTCDDDEHGVFIITEYVPGGDLRQWLKNPEKQIPWMLRVQISLDVTYAMSYLFGKHFMHRDLKSKNILVDELTLRAKLCDFGFAREYTMNEGNITVKVGTDKWMAPEVIMGKSYDFRADVFSFGCVLIELLTREKPPNREPRNKFGYVSVELEQLIKAKTSNDPPPPEFLSLMLLCVDTEPEKRPPYTQILEKLQILQTSLTKQQ